MPQQPEAHAEEGIKIREQVRQAAEEGSRVQLPQPTEGCEKEGIHPRRRGQGGE